MAIIVTLAQRADLEKRVRRLDPDVWPTFMLQNEMASKYWRRLYTTFPEYQFALCDSEEEVIASGHSIPIDWDGSIANLPESWEAVLEKGFLDNERHLQPNAIALLSIAVAPDHQKKGLSSLVLSAIKSLGANHGLAELIAPVRPTYKSRYPLTSMEDYIKWRNAKGAPYDPWLRVHWRQGAEILKIAPRSLIITGTVAEWEKWTDMIFPESGNYIIPGALQPVAIDREKDIGHYEDPCVWMRTRIMKRKEI